MLVKQNAGYSAAHFKVFYQLVRSATKFSTVNDPPSSSHQEQLQQGQILPKDQYKLVK